MGINRFKKGDRVRPNERLLELARGLHGVFSTSVDDEHRATVVATGEFDAGEAELIYVQWDHKDTPSTCHPSNLDKVETRRSVWQRLMDDDEPV